jgi:hypothetical protein
VPRIASATALSALLSGSSAGSGAGATGTPVSGGPGDAAAAANKFTIDADPSHWYNLFHPGTRAIVYGVQLRAIQGMLDFDYLWYVPARAQPARARPAQRWPRSRCTWASGATRQDTTGSLF